MSDSAESCKVDKKLCIGVFVTAGILRVALALAPLRWLMLKNFPDDSYMYWQVARNIVTGHGASLDGTNLTTAYHPLWMVPTMAVMALFDNGNDLPIHVSLLLGGLLDLIAGYLVYKTAMLLTKRDEKISLLAAAIYFFNPYQLGFVLSGLGDGVNALLVLAYFYLYLKMRAEERDDLMGWIAVGLVAGLAMLARTDSVVFHIPILLHMLLTRDARSMVNRFRAPIIVGLASSALVVPWLCYMYAVTGHFMQSSASSQPVANHMTMAAWSMSAKVIYAINKFLSAIFWKIPNAAAWGPVLVTLALMFLGKKNGASDAQQEMTRRWRGYLLLPVYGLLALAFIHGVIRLSVRQWYILPSSWTAALWFALFWKAYGTVITEKTRKILGVVMVAGFLVTFTRTWVIGYYPWQVDMYDMGYQLREVLPKSDRPIVGGFNILAQAYYNPNLIMNLDGIGNDAIMEHIRNFTLGTYIDQVGLKYLVDWDFFIAKRYGFFIKTDLQDRLKPIIRCKSPGSAWKWSGPFTLYEILPPGSKTDRNAPAPVPCKRLGYVADRLLATPF